jgi:hypothetical protein
VISYVPYEQRSLEYGPREYLHQIMSLISRLRGGQQRYMPLLISKINDTMPHAPLYNFNSTAESTYGTDVYGSSEQTRSAPASSVSSPFGTPPLSATEQHMSFGAFQQGVITGLTSTPVEYANAIVTTGFDAEIPVSAPMQLFSDPTSFPGLGQVRYDSDG